jgi:hypothetical protein
MAADIIELIESSDHARYDEYGAAWNLQSFTEDYGGELVVIS